MIKYNNKIYIIFHISIVFVIIIFNVNVVVLIYVNIQILNVLNRGKLILININNIYVNSKIIKIN